jgi:hypothetical protein
VIWAKVTLNRQKMRLINPKLRQNKPNKPLNWLIVLLLSSKCAVDWLTDRQVFGLGKMAAAGGELSFVQIACPWDSLWLY